MDKTSLTFLFLTFSFIGFSAETPANDDRNTEIPNTNEIWDISRANPARIEAAQC